MTITLPNQNGGIGKTTLAIHSAGEREPPGKSGARFDADPPRSAFDGTPHPRSIATRRFEIFQLANVNVHGLSSHSSIDAS